MYFDEKLLSLIFTDPKLYHQRHDGRKVIILDNKNLINPQLLSVFKNAKKLLILTTDWSGSVVYPVSFESLLSVIDGTPVTHVRIRGPGIEDSHNPDRIPWSWLDDTLSTFDSIKKQFRKKKQNIAAPLVF